jgi:Spy/CpxP family protein refolding chaperone
MVGAGGTFTVTDRPRALAVLIAVFLVGGIVGSAAAYYWIKKTPSVPVESRGNTPPPLPERQRLPAYLNLTPDQEKQFREIMAEARAQLDPLRIEQDELRDALRTKQAPKIEAIWAETNRKFSAILNEEQKAKFTAFLKEMENWRKRPPPPPRGRGRDLRR